MQPRLAHSRPRLTGLLLLGLASTPLAQAGPGPGMGNNANQPPLLQDINPNPRVFEVNLTAGVTTTEYTPGVSTTVWAYNDSVPGPTIRAGLGQTWWSTSPTTYPRRRSFMPLSVPGHTIQKIGAGGGRLNTPVNFPPIDGIADPSGGGMISNPDRSLGILLSPSERADVVLVPRGQAGEESFMEWHDVPMGRHQTFYNPDGSIGFGDADDDGKRPMVQIAKLRFVKGSGNGWHPRRPLALRSTSAIPVDDQTERLSVFFGHAPPMPDGSVPCFASVPMEAQLQGALDNMLAACLDPANAGPIPGMVGPPPFMPVPFKKFMPGDGLNAEVGDIKFYEVTNFTGSDHTFHTHGFPFQALEVVSVNLDGDSPAERVIVTPVDLADEASFIIPQRPGALARSWTILRAAVRYDDSAKPAFLRRSAAQMVASGLVPSGGPIQDPDNDTSGGWLVHCHFLEHADAGMTTMLNLVLPD